MAEIIKNKYLAYDSPNLNAKNIGFKSGSQESLNSLITNGNATEGTFYLTTDTHRLYIGRTIREEKNGVDYNQNDSTTYTTKTIPISVNEGIQTVEYVSNLTNINANAGEFYYASEDNILCIYNGAQWTQINPDTDTDTKVTSISITPGNAIDNNGKITYSVSLSQTSTDKNGTALANQPSAVTTSFTVDASSIAGLVSTGLEASTASNNSTTLSTTGTHANNSETVSIKTEGGISLTGGGSSDVTITGTTYSVSAALDGTDTTKANVILTDSHSNTDSISLKTGANLTIDSVSNDIITIKHTGAGTASGGTFGDNTSGAVSEGATVKIPKITKDENGHINSITDVSVTLPTAVRVNAVTADNTGKITITENNANIITSGNNSVLYHKITVDGTENTINNQNSLGTFYSASKVDDLITKAKQTINGMTYKGTVGSNESTAGANLPTTNVSVGDTYAVNNAATIFAGTGNSIEGGSNGSKACQVGDILIASGTESTTTGYITGAITWNYIPAGDIDTQYNLTIGTGTNPSLKLEDTNNNQDSVTFEGGTAISVNGSTSGNTDKITISHKNSNVTAGTYGAAANTNTALAYSGTFVVPRLTVDAQGHITAAEGKTYTLPASDNTTYSLGNASGSNTYDTTIRLTDNSDNHTDITLVGGNKITASGTSGTITFNHDALTSAQQTNPTVPTNASDIPAGGMTVVTGVTRDSYGHVTGYTVGKYKVPSALTYSLTNSLSGNKVTSTMKNSADNTVGTLAYTSSNLTFTEVNDDNDASTHTTYSIDLKWGTF